MQAQESARARVREIEAAVKRVRRELEEVDKKERNAFALKENSMGNLVAAVEQQWVVSLFGVEA